MMVEGSEVAGRGDATSLHSSNLHSPFVALLLDCSRLSMAEQQLKEITFVNPPAPTSKSTSIDPLSQPPQPTLSKRKKWWSSSRFWCIVIVVFVILLIFGLLIGLYYKHVNPQYQIDNVHVKISPNQYPDYNITLKVKNQNDISSIVYDKGVASLFSGPKEIAKGKYQQFKQHPRSSHDVTMILHGSTTLPKIEPSMNIADIRKKIPLFLSIDVPVKVEIGSLKVRSKNIRVKCSFTLDKLDRDTTILGENCVSEG